MVIFQNAFDSTKLERTTLHISYFFIQQSMVSLVKALKQKSIDVCILEITSVVSVPGCITLGGIASICSKFHFQQTLRDLRGV